MVASLETCSGKESRLETRSSQRDLHDGGKDRDEAGANDAPLSHHENESMPSVRFKTLLWLPPGMQEDLI